ncbi:MAG: dTMP kinase [Cyanobacteria bacterium P01_E01_bin.48]
MESRAAGLFVTLEGGEGAGKTTLQTYLLHRLAEAGYDCIGTREPGGTPLGHQLREILLHRGDLATTTELLLYAADRAEHVATVIRPALATGQIVICDRFTDSTVAYQGYGRGLDSNAIASLNQMATEGLQPDLTLWLDLPVTVGLTRARQRAAAAELDRFERTELDFHQRLREGFTAISARHPERVCRLDASQPADIVAAAAWDRLRNTLVTRTLVPNSAA